jgi:hypothetical protein
MIYLICGLVTGGILTAICWPLFAAEQSAASAVLEETEWDLLQRKKDVILGNIQDLDFEHQCGKLSNQDHESVRNELVAEANTVFHAIDEIESAQDLDALIRREVASRKTRVPDPAACSGCGHVNPRGNKFCAECGARLAG